MALTATIYNLDVQLSDTDRGVYEALAFKVAQQPSESDEHMVARVLAYCLEYTEGIGFSKGIAEPEEPALFVRDLTGALRTWIDIGSPDAARLHKASKAAPRVVVYTHKDPAQLVRALAGERIHRAESLELYALDRDLIADLVSRRDRRTKFDLTVTEGHLYVSIDGETLEGIVEKIER
ncbi:MAG TPA: YaeQ family protein [Gemmatimonadaceae bacterium]|nr:YaeQ family protein [Gemmatimonadaceae bacterium]